MKRILFVLPLLFGMAYGQSKLYMRADTIQMYKDGGNANLKLMNATRDSLGPLVTIGQGRTKFISYRALGDSIGLGDSLAAVRADLSGIPTLQQVTTAGYTTTNSMWSLTGNIYAGYGLYDGTTSSVGAVWNDDYARAKLIVDPTFGGTLMMIPFGTPSNETSVRGKLHVDGITGARNYALPDYSGIVGVHPTISGQGGKVLAVNAGATALEWIVAGGGTTETASNGLTKVTNDIQLGGSLTGNTTITAGANNLAITGSDVPLKSTTTSIILPAIQGINNSGGNGVEGSSTTGIAVTGASTAGTAIQGTTNTGVAGILQINPATTNTAATVLRLNRLSSGSAANGIGGTIDLYAEDTGGTMNLTNQIVSTWSDATNATRTSEFKITGVNSGSIADKFIVKGNGVINIPTALGNYANNAAAIAGGLSVGDLYRNGDVLQVVH